MTNIEGTGHTTDEIIAGIAELPTRGFDKVIGFRYSEASTDGIKAEWTVTPDLHQPFGIVHGGVYCAVIESVASISGAIWLGDKGHVVGVNNNTDFLRAVESGTLYAASSPIHRGRSQQLWQVVITDEQGRTVARGQVRLQNMTNPKS